MLKPEAFLQAEYAARFIGSKCPVRPNVAVVLGSGLGDFANELAQPSTIPFGEIPHFPVSTAIGHAGNLVIGNFVGLSLAVMQGRAHFYEGNTFAQAAFPMRVLHQLGVKAVVLTNAAGGINPQYGRGALVMVRDHINMMGGSPLIGPNDDRFGPRFPDMTYAYDREYRKIAEAEAKRLDIPYYEGIYAAMHGPSYETPAEIQMLARMGADLVGMSTVPEVIVARHMDVRVLAISCVTNMAAGLSGEAINHEEVLETGRRVKDTFLALLRAVLPKIAASVA
ncbi:purine nucleoside phosphorylase I, inosine and guanosine-specific [Candidatus Koribacter versatilis Ellin345]|uniref:Purine nucleoside phosphorylase n=1 Tax=Koribacter versatilis (strain Ellin345) TaxID=204669 RepID=Q1IM44_KORVE|nr:purine-nucleoside phosphorylase [Candidatus Koribacter versatilis]ABF42056.1 purine nucleoside phosphorylase I, inosine and guanosine-specific [Candidatus Koribacter versatilis Ellin345]